MDKEISELNKKELLDLFRAAHSEVIEIEIVSDGISQKENELYYVRETSVVGWTVEKIIGMCFLGLFGFSISFLISTLLGQFNDSAITWSVILATAFVIIAHNMKKANIRNYIKENNQRLTNEINELEIKLDETIKRCANKIYNIPATYRYSLALNKMQEYIINERATEWVRCVDLYEEQVYRWVMEKNSQESVELQRQILMYTENAARGANAAAVFSGISAVANVAQLFK